MLEEIGFGRLRGRQVFFVRLALGSFIEYFGVGPFECGCLDIFVFLFLWNIICSHFRYYKSIAITHPTCPHGTHFNIPTTLQTHLFSQL